MMMSRDSSLVLLLLLALRDVVERRRRLSIIIAFGEVGIHSKKWRLKAIPGKEITHWISLHIFVSRTHIDTRDVSNERERERR